MTAANQRSKAEFETIRAQFVRTGQAAHVHKLRTALVDSIVQEAWGSTLAQLPECGCTLLAVGGYGRQELFPYSDVDIIFLARRPFAEKESKEALSEFLKHLWDSGLRASQSVRTVEECCSVVEGNYELTVSLLDQRYLAGDSTLFAALQERFARFLGSERKDLTRRMCRMARARHAKFHQTIYRLEPDLKEHPGGIRDLHTVRWLGILREDGEASAEDLRATDFLWMVRTFLHYRAGRDSNLFNFEAQDEIARAPFSPWSDPAEWMQGYFRHAHATWRRVNTELERSESQERSLLANFRDWRSRLSNPEFTVSRDRVYLRNPHDLAADAELPLRLMLFSARHGLPPARETEQRLNEQGARLATAYAAPGTLGIFWRQFLSLPKAIETLRGMNDSGFLPVLLPEWRKIEHRVVRDFYHLYTVDEHTLVALESLQNLAENADAAVQRFRGLLEESQQDLWLLRFAILLHDIGKGTGSDHASKGEFIAEDAVARTGLAEHEAELVLFLVRSHLLLSGVMQGKDLNDPATARMLAEHVPTIEKLRLLTLMTWADISAVNTTAMSPWRAEQLWRVYRQTARVLTSALTGERIDAAPEEAYGTVPLEMQDFLEGLPRRYVWTHTRQDAEVHVKLYQRARESGVGLEVVRKDGIYRLSALAPDRPFLFSSIAGALSSFGLNILKAEAFTNRRGYIADTFVFSDPTRNLDLNPPELERLRVTLTRVITGEVRAQELLKYRVKRSVPAPSAAIHPAVSVDQEVSDVATVYEVLAEDRPGLLYDLTSAISRSGCNIEVVLVDTEAHRGIDVFHVTRNQAKLDDEAAETLRVLLEQACTPQS